MKVNIRPGGQAGAQCSASSGEVSGHSIFETLWRATSKQPLLLQLLVLCSLLWLGLFLSFLSAFVYLVFFYTTHAHALTHTENKRNRNHLFKIRFLVTSFINFRFLFIYSKTKTFARLVFALSSRLVSLFRLFGQHINNHLPVAGVTRQTPLPVVAVVVVVVGVICK